MTSSDWSAPQACRVEVVRRSLLWYLPGPIRTIIFFSVAKRILFAPGAPSQAVRLGLEEVWTCRPESILNDVAAARGKDLVEAARGRRVPFGRE